MTGFAQFAWTSRLLHWLMAAMMLAMVFIGASMVTSLSYYPVLLAIHRPLGLSILVVAVLRVINRRLRPPPDFLPTMPSIERRVIVWSERLLYILMFALPLVGWGLLSAGGYPIVFSGALVIPPILPHSTDLYCRLRTAHTFLAYVFFATVLAHLGGVLFHSIVLRDGLILRMAPWRASSRPPDDEGPSPPSDT